jgi:hypothetical protein
VYAVEGALRKNLCVRRPKNGADAEIAAAQRRDDGYQSKSVADRIQTDEKDRRRIRARA